MSQKPSGYERLDGDRYFTPAWVTHALLNVEHFVGGVIDPCAGGWDMVHAISTSDHGLQAYGFDILPPPPALTHRPMFYTQDFLAWQGTAIHGEGWRNFALNPPYGTQGRLAVKFIEHALQLAGPRRGKVAALLRVDFDSAGGRAMIFRDHPAFAAKYALNKRIHWANLPLKYDQHGRLIGPTENHAWFVWDWARRPDSQRYYGYLP